ncbi:MAG: hypothetical protein WCD89_09225 [Anaerocolumna sp.]
MVIPTTMLQAILATLVAAWSSDVAVPSAPETAIRAYYDAHASENNGHCRAPYIEGFHTVDVVEDNAERVVVETSYLYRDMMKDRQAWRIGDDRSPCVAVNSRRFVLIRDRSRLQVAEMSPPLHG